MSETVTFAQQALGLDLSPRWREVLGDYFSRPGGDATWCVGRQAAKTTAILVSAAYCASILAPEYRRLVPRGRLHAILVSANLLTAREALDRLAGWYEESPLLKGTIRRRTSEELHLRGDIAIVCLPSQSRATRGRTAFLVALDEAAFLQDGDGNAAAESIYRALAPSTLRLGVMGRRIVSSSPWLRHGWFFDLVSARQAAGDPLTVQGSTQEFFPGIDPAYLAAEQARDPDAYQADYLGQFLDVSASSFLDPEAIDRAIRARPSRRDPADGVSYVAAADPAFSARGDAFALAIGHSEDGRVVIDRLDAWRATGDKALDFDRTLDQVAAVVKSYRARCVTDQALGPAVVQGLERRGVAVEYAPWSNASKWEAMSALRGALNGSRLELPPDPDLRRELRGLQMTVTPSGRPSVQGAGRASDDRAVAVAVLAHRLAGGAYSMASRVIPPATTTYHATGWPRGGFADHIEQVVTQQRAEARLAAEAARQEIAEEDAGWRRIP